MALSPMMQHYMEVKNEYKDTIIFYRLGDFYEMFFDDAVEVSRVLELTLTGRNCGLEEKAPMCGVPYHSANTYIERLIKKGYKVAICEQVEDPKEAKGMVKRQVVRIVTKGTLTSMDMLEEDMNNYLLSLYVSKEGAGIAYCDISTGELKVTEKEWAPDFIEGLVNEVSAIGASEIIVNEEGTEVLSADMVLKATGVLPEMKPAGMFGEKAGGDVIASVLGKGAVAASGLTGRTLALRSLSGLLSYLIETQKQSLRQISFCEFYEAGMTMSLDRATLRNLEVLETLYEKRREGSLLGILDKTDTAMGARLLRRWIKEPLNDSEEINRRLAGVEELISDPVLEDSLREFLKNIYDFERLTGRIASERANGRDLTALANSLKQLPEIKKELSLCSSPILKEICSSIDDFEEIEQHIRKAITEDPPLTITEGGLINPGYDEELDDILEKTRDAREWIKNLEPKERERTGIKKLRAGYNKVFGYYLEVPRAFSEDVPEDYIRKQTLVNSERFITPELKEMEMRVVSATEKINKIQYRVFCELRSRVMEYTKQLQKTAAMVAALDVLVSFAYVSTRNGYVKPIVDDSDILDIKNGRHPVIEKMATDGGFVPNDATLDCEENSFMVITGPNMSGKSTFMRQIAIIVLMAQAGCFVPCDSAHIGVVDRIFTRIGASDNLSRGQSTFYVEMSELSYILNNATDRSLVILDEIGRGTSTYDGLAIAWAVTEYLCNSSRHIKTLFATHYHELTELEKRFRGVKNLNVDVSDEGGEIVFLHKIVDGSASRSYGIHVAKIAGVPEELIENAEKKLQLLETGERENSEVLKQQPAQVAAPATTPTPEPAQTTFDIFVKDEKAEELKSKIREIDIFNLTPSEAIKTIEELKGIVK